MSQSTLDQIRLAHTYGLWIANSDMHLGNLTLVPEGNVFRLHPVYDMVPMRLAPQRGELLNVELAPPQRNADNFDLWEQAGGVSGARFGRGSATMNGFPSQCGSWLQSTPPAAKQ